jgi:PAS domain S-box-containing protein
MNQDDFSSADLIAAISGVSGMTLQIHKDFKPIYVTAEYARLYGFENTEEFMKIGSIMDLIPEDFRDLAKERYKDVIANGNTEILTIKTQRLNGEEVWVKLQDKRLEFKGDFCVLTVLIEITEEVAVREAFELSAKAEKEARLELERLQTLMIEREKQSALNHLLVGVSHQLNTPLGNIRTSSTLVEILLKDITEKLKNKTLRESDLESSLTEAIAASHVVDNSVKKASELINNVKYMVSETFDTDKGSTHFSPVILDAVRLYSQTVEKINISIECDIDGDIYTNTNPNTWMQIVSILCENSFIHGFSGRSQGQITVTADFTESHFEFRYNDNGCGIQPSQQERIFEAFYSTQMGSNSGLGLALVYNLVTKALGGTVHVESGEAVTGTTFVIKLPIRDFYIN